MEKELKELNRLYRKAKDEKVKEHLSKLIDELDKDEEEVTPKDEEVKQETQKEEVVKQEVKEEAPKQDLDFGELKKHLELEKIEAIIVEQNKQIESFKEQFKKLQSRGYAPASLEVEEEISVDDIFNSLKQNYKPNHTQK